MIAELLVLFADPAPRAVPEPKAIEARYRRRRIRKAPSIITIEEVAPRKVQSLRVIEEDGKWLVLRSGTTGIDDVYSRVPPFNRSKP